MSNNISQNNNRLRPLTAVNLVGDLRDFDEDTGTTHKLRPITAHNIVSSNSSQTLGYSSQSTANKSKDIKNIIDPTIILSDTENIVTQRDNNKITGTIPLSYSNVKLSPITNRRKTLKSDEEENETTEYYFGDSGKAHLYETYMTANTARKALGDDREFSARTKYLQNCNDRNLVPDPLIIRKRPCFKMEYQYFGLGNDYTLAMGESLSTIPDTESIDLRHNLIRNDGISLLCNGLSINQNHVRELILTGNNLGEKGCESLSIYLSSSNCVLFVLVLEKCSIGRKGGLALSRGLEENQSLRLLNVSDNDLDGDTAASISVSISMNPFINSLQMAWNNISGYGAASFAKSLGINDSLTFIDLSYNGFGHSPLSSSITYFSFTILANERLEHINLSRNNIAAQDIEILSNALKNNFVVKGLHIGGSDGHMDSKGYLHSCRLPDAQGFDHLKDIPEPYCWMCNHYQEVFYTFTPGVSSDASIDVRSVYLKLDIDKFIGDQMNFNPEKHRYELYRMVPPGKSYYYFNLNKETDITAKDQWTTNNFLIIDNEINICEVPIEDPDIPAICHHVAPRSTPSIDDDKSSIKPKSLRIPAWNSNKSVMNQRGSENDGKKAVDGPEAYEKAFDFDWKNVCFGRMLKDERKLEMVRQAWISQYNLLRSTFQWYAALSINGPENLNLNDFVDIISDIELLLDSNMKLKDIENIWVESYRENKEITDPKSQLIGRPKFMELLTRVSIARFSTKKKGIKANDAVIKIMDEYVKSFGKHVEPTGFRSLLMTAPYDEILKSYISILKGVFAEVAKRHIPKSDKVYIDFNTFENMTNHVKFKEDGLEDIQVIQCFLQSKCLVFDEVKGNGKHRVLTFYEFVEAVCRFSNHYPFSEYDLPSGAKSNPGIYKLSVLLRKFVLRIKNFTPNMKKSMGTITAPTAAPPPINKRRL